MTAVLGRTNWEAPKVWYRLVTDKLEQAELILNSLPSGSVVTIDGPIVGHACRGREIVRLFDLGFDYERSMNSNHAVDLVSSSLMQAMALAGQPEVSLAVLPVRKGLWGGQVEGALKALECARQDGVVRHVGLRVAGPWPLVKPVWRQHDAFDFVITPTECSEDVLSFAHERRVGVVVQGEAAGGYAHIIEISSELIGVH